MVFFALITVDFICKRTLGEVVVLYNLFFDIEPRHQGFARVRVGTEPAREQLFRAEHRRLLLSQPVSLFAELRDYLRLGMEHIFTGYDHLAFLFGLLLVAGFASLRKTISYILGVVSAFTVAHSLTLIAAGLDWVRLAPRLVEPAIALSILYVAIENLTTQPRNRWLLTFGFGLVHGFGFASVLREIGLPTRGLVLSLLSFNVGVELGQLAVVGLAAPALYLLSREVRKPQDLTLFGLFLCALTALLLLFGLPRPQLLLSTVALPLLFLWTIPRLGFDRAVRVGGSFFLVLLAGFWFFERVLQRSWLGGVLG